MDTHAAAAVYKEQMIQAYMYTKEWQHFSTVHMRVQHAAILYKC